MKTTTLAKQDTMGKPDGTCIYSTHLRENGHERPGRGRCGGTVDFVRSVMTVVVPVADPRFHDATLVGALELPRFASVTAAVGLVRAVDAVALAVAFPRQRQAVAIRSA